MLMPITELCARVRCYGCSAPGSWLCSTCRDSLIPTGEGETIPGIARIHSAWRYEGAARNLILALKLRAERSAALPLAGSLFDVIQRDGTGAGVVTWVPARRKDRRVRGFDHAELIARTLSARLGLPAAPLLARTSTRQDQAGLTRVERKRNLLGAFQAAAVKENVLLVDDLITTGATAEACGRALTSAGAMTVEVAAPCRV
jgi:competence protein ComFC